MLVILLVGDDSTLYTAIILDCLAILICFYLTAVNVKLSKYYIYCRDADPSSTCNHEPIWPHPIRTVCSNASQSTALEYLPYNTYLPDTTTSLSKNI